MSKSTSQALPERQRVGGEGAQERTVCARIANCTLTVRQGKGFSKQPSCGFMPQQVTGENTFGERERYLNTHLSMRRVLSARKLCVEVHGISSSPMDLVRSCGSTQDMAESFPTRALVHTGACVCVRACVCARAHARVRVHVHARGARA
eukprot:4031314-Pleurochrysis_carterae.AAC.3